jgi:hypothetical protein
MIIIRVFAVLLAALATLGAARAPSGAADPEPRGRAVLDGFVLGPLPPDLGRHMSDFAYDWGDVAFHSRVWERGPDSSGATHVDMTAEVLRGAKLSDPAALRAFLAHYLEKPAETWHPRGSRGRPGFAGPDDAFFLDRPGVAVYARLEKSGAGPGPLLQFLDGVRRDV